MLSVGDKMESDDDDMDQDFPESVKSDSSFSDSAGSGSDDEESELDEAESEKRRTECMDKMSDLESQFVELKEHLFKEKSLQVHQKLEEVKLGTAKEYQDPVARLQESMKIRLQIAEIRLALRKKNLENHADAEKQAALQNLECEKRHLRDSIFDKIQDQIQRLKQDRHNTDLTAGMYVEMQSTKKKKFNSSSNPDRRRKPVTVTGPYIVYMLKESQIFKDFSTIRMALKQRGAGSQRLSESSANSARHEDGKLFYNGDWYLKGNKIKILCNPDPPVHATITSVNGNEVQIKREDGTAAKLYMSQLQLGKYSIKLAY